jgi:hypothetical protein
VDAVKRLALVALPYVVGAWVALTGAAAVKYLLGSP